MKCPYCAEEIKDDAKKCRFCGEFLVAKSNANVQEIIKSKKVSYNYCGKVYYKYGKPSIFCPVCGHEGYSDWKNEYEFLIRLLVFILCMVRGVGLIGAGLYMQWQEYHSICKCPNCGNTKLCTNDDPEKLKGWRKLFFFTGLIVRSIFGLFIYFKMS